MTFAKTVLTAREAMEIANRIKELQVMNTKDIIRKLAGEQAEEIAERQRQKTIEKLSQMPIEGLIERAIDDEFGPRSYEMYSQRKIVEV